MRSLTLKRGLWWTARLFLCLLIVMEILGLMPVLSWLGPGLVTKAMVVQVLIKAIALAIFLTLYLWVVRLMDKPPTKQGPLHAPTFTTGPNGGADSAFEERFYAEAAQEISDKRVSPGLWAKAFSDAEGDQAKASARYIALRVEQTRHEWSAKTAQQARERAEEEQTRKTAEEAKRKAEFYERAAKEKPPIFIFWGFLVAVLVIVAIRFFS